MAKDIKFSADARSSMVRGVDILANTVKVTWALKAAMSFWKNPLAHPLSPMTV